MTYRPDPTVAAMKAAEKAARDREDRFEDIRFLLEMGLKPAAVADRLGATQEAIHRQAIRWGQRDIADAFSALPRTRKRPSRAKRVAA